jgi:hypothetical protein
VNSACSNFIYRLILGTKIHDLSGGFKCYRRKVIESLEFDEFFSRGYSIGVETLFRCYKKRYTFLEIPIVFQNRSKGKSKFHPREALKALKVIFQLVLKYGRAIRILEKSSRNPISAELSQASESFSPPPQGSSQEKRA